MAVTRRILIIKSIKAPQSFRPEKTPNKQQDVKVWNEHLYINAKVTHIMLPMTHIPEFIKYLLEVEKKYF